jgi:uncharacterized cupredoxin-like copper-binding protein
MPRHPMSKPSGDRPAGSRLRITVIAIVLALALPILGIGALLGSPQGTTAAQATATPEPCPPATPTPGTPTPTLCVVVGEYDIYFQPNLITIPADTPVRVVLPNHGATVHDFSITDHGNPGLPNLNIAVTTDPGQTSETVINAPEGAYYFFCNQPGHEQAGMRGYLEVKKDAPISVSEATVTPRAG